MGLVTEEAAQDRITATQSVAERAKRGLAVVQAVEKSIDELVVREVTVEVLAESGDVEVERDEPVLVLVVEGEFDLFDLREERFGVTNPTCKPGRECAELLAERLSVGRFQHHLQIQTPVGVGYLLDPNDIALDVTLRAVEARDFGLLLLFVGLLVGALLVVLFRLGLLVVPLCLRVIRLTFLVARRLFPAAHTARAAGEDGRERGTTTEQDMSSVHTAFITTYTD